MTSSRYSRQSSTSPLLLSYFKAQGIRRINATQPKQEDLYIDTRNLWKASTAAQDKQYESIRSSGLLSSNRKLTFVKFNYRNSQDKNVCYPDVFQTLQNKQKQQLDSKRRFKSKKMVQKINKLKSTLVEDLKYNTFKVQKNWLEEYHETDKQDELEYNKKQYLALGTMNVNDLWGDKQLQECLGYLPCKRDRSKMLKFYSTNLRRIKYKNQQFDKQHFSNYY